MRSGQQVRIATLSEMHTMDVDMQTIVIVGSSKSYIFEDFMITPRGYMDKYRVN